MIHRSARPRRTWLAVVPFAAALIAATACARAPEPAYRGLYIGGEGAQELNAFTPCGDTAFLWVEGDRRTVERLRRAHTATTSSLFRPIYIEIAGRAIPRGDSRLDRMYSGIIHVDSVLVQKSHAPLTCTPMPRRADGSEGRRFPW